MRLFTALTSVLLLAGISPAVAKKDKNKASPTGPSSAAATTKCMPTKDDASVVEFAYALESLGNHFYASTSLNTTTFVRAPNDSMALWYPNFRGIEKRGNLSLMAIEYLGKETPTYKAPKCNFTLPTPSSPSMLLDMAYHLEASLSGAYIGLAGYSESPEVAFLMARLATGHGGNAIYVQSHVMEPIFSDRNNSMVPVFPPEHVLSRGRAPGRLGDYMHDCVKMPVKPCGKTLVVGNTSGNLTDNTSIISKAMATQTAAP